MVLASEVWKCFLFPPWSNQATAEPVQDLDFTAEDPEAPFVLLCVVHLGFEDIMYDSPPKQVLLDLAFLCDQYLCHHLIRPWAANWIHRQHEFDLANPSDGPGERSVSDWRPIIMLAYVFRPALKPDYFEMGVHWLFNDSLIYNLPDFNRAWPLPDNLMST